MGMRIIDNTTRAKNDSPCERHHIGNPEIVKGFPAAAAIKLGKSKLFGVIQQKHGG